MEQSSKHHYVPRFYLSCWTQKDTGQLTAFQWRSRGPNHPPLLSKREYSPNGIGYQRGLYSDLSGSTNEEQEAVERNFMAPVDSEAAEALVAIKRAMGKPASQRQVLAWTYFLLSLHRRHPVNIAALRQTCERQWGAGIEKIQQDYLRLKQPDEPDHIIDWCAQRRLQPEHVLFPRTFTSLVTSGGVSPIISGAYWGVRNLRQPLHPLMTSDRPLIFRHTLDNPRFHLVLPLSPSSFFLVTGTEDSMRKGMQLKEDAVVERINRAIVHNARRFVVAPPTAEGYVRRRLTTATDFPDPHIGLSKYGLI